MGLLLQSFRRENQLFHLLRPAVDIYRSAVERNLHTSHISDAQANFFVRANGATLLCVEDSLPQTLAIGRN